MVEMVVRTAMIAKTVCNFFRCININSLYPFSHLASSRSKTMWNRITRSLSANLALILLAIVCVSGAVSLARQAASVLRDSASARARVEELAAKKKKLEEEIRERTREESVRYQAKARLNLKNPGENIVVILPEKKEPAPEAPYPLWQKITSFFQKIISK